MINDIKKEELEKVVIESKSYVDVIEKLGLDKSSSSLRKHISRLVKKLNINVDHFTFLSKVKNSKEIYLNKEKLEILVNNNNSITNILNEMGLLAVSRNYKTLKKYLKFHNIDYSKFNKTDNIKYDKDNLEKIVKESFTYKECLLKLDIRAAGNNSKTLKKYIKLYNIDNSHFNPNYFNIVMHVKSKKIDLENILVENSSYSRSHLKERLFDLNILENKCCLCGQDENWNDMKISLILDHINGVFNDNRIENLRIVCPNCNAGLDTHCRGSKGLNKNKFEIINNNTSRYDKCECDKTKLKTSKKCKDCSFKTRRKIERPNIEILLEDVKKLGYCGTGRKYGVSDNCIRKWIKN
jgi:hypothetical protein